MMVTIKLLNVGEQKRTVRVYGADSLHESNALHQLVSVRLDSNKELKVGDKIEAWKVYDTINTYKVTKVLMNGDYEMRAVGA